MRFAYNLSYNILDKTFKYLDNWSVYFYRSFNDWCPLFGRDIAVYNQIKTNLYLKEENI